MKYDQQYATTRLTYSTFCHLYCSPSAKSGQGESISRQNSTLVLAQEEPQCCLDVHCYKFTFKSLLRCMTTILVAFGNDVCLWKQRDVVSSAQQHYGFFCLFFFFSKEHVMWFAYRKKSPNVHSPAWSPKCYSDNPHSRTTRPGSTSQHLITLYHVILKQCQVLTRRSICFLFCFVFVFFCLMSSSQITEYCKMKMN